jgi:hypothetical protein
VLILLTSAFVEITPLLSTRLSKVSSVKGRKYSGPFHMNPGVALQAAAALLEMKVLRTRGGYRHVINTLKWRCESFEQEVIEIMSDQAMCLLTIEDLEVALGVMSSLEAEDLDRSDKEDEIESNK